MTPLTNERLAEIKEIRGRLECGEEWEYEPTVGIMIVKWDEYISVDTSMEPNNGYFIAAAPEIVDELLAEIDRLKNPPICKYCNIDIAIEGDDVCSACEDEWR